MRYLRCKILCYSQEQKRQLELSGKDEEPDDIWHKLTIDLKIITAIREVGVDIDGERVVMEDQCGVYIPGEYIIVDKSYDEMDKLWRDAIKNLEHE